MITFTLLSRRIWGSVQQKYREDTGNTHTYNPMTFHAVTVGKLIVEPGDLKPKGRVFFHICNFLNIIKIKRIFKILGDWLGNVPPHKVSIKNSLNAFLWFFFFCSFVIFRKCISSNWRYSSHMEKRARTVSFLEMLVRGRVNTYVWGVRMVTWHSAVPFTGEKLSAFPLRITVHWKTENLVLAPDVSDRWAESSLSVAWGLFSLKRKRWSNLSPMVLNEALYVSVDISKN